MLTLARLLFSPLTLIPKLIVQEKHGIKKPFDVLKNQIA
jgi:hypothetical protein